MAFGSTGNFGFGSAGGSGGGSTVKSTNLYVYTATGSEGTSVSLAPTLAGVTILSVTRSQTPLNPTGGGSPVSSQFNYNTDGTFTFGNNLQAGEVLLIQYRAT